jgi:hypothetical protein
MRIRRSLAVLTLTAGLFVSMGGPALAADDLNCDDFSSQVQAQATFDADPSDPNNLDEDDDGQACEDFNYGSTAGTGTGTGIGTGGGGNGQVATPPAGGVATGDGSSAGSDTHALPFVVGGLGLVAAGGAAFAARRSARGSA